MTDATPSPLSPRKPVFATTRWSRVLKARGDSSDAKAALADLSAAYYAPVLAFIRSHSPDEESARDLTQEFFARLLANNALGHPDPQRGRFRSFLLGAVKHFLSDARDQARRLKRGAGQPLEPLSPGTDTSPGLQLPDPKSPSADHEFDRKWALTLLGRALSALAREHTDAGKSEQFEILKPWLTGDTADLSQADAADRLDCNEGAVKVAIHRLRRRFRDLIKAEISHTVPDPAQVAEELRHLFQALS